MRAALSERYAIERELGRGGMAVVYLARDEKLNRRVALKVLRPELAASLGAERFLREIEIAAKLTHPNILSVYDCGEARGHLYYTMPAVEGESLRTRLARDGPLPFDDAIQIAKDVADALAYAHGLGVVHRDIKPENVLIQGRRALVTDFGVARAVSAASGPLITGAGVALGTPAYMAPEQAAADPHVDHRLDIYALGTITYEMLTGRPPFQHASVQELLAAHINTPADPVSHHRSDVPPEFEHVVMRCLEKEPGDRWQTADELRMEFEKLTTPITGVPLAARPRTARRRRRRLWVTAVAAVGVVAVGALLRPGGGASLDPDLLVVTPFDVLDARLADPWHEGFAQIVANNLDGAGPLRAVPPTVIFRRWQGSADAATVRAAAEATGAGLAVYGRLLAAGADSVRLNATLYDVAAGTVIAEFAMRDVADRIDRLADSLSIRVLDELRRVRPMGDARLGSLGSSSPTAVKAFLQGEQSYWRMELDSAQRLYERAIEEDSTFALAHNRLAHARSWGSHPGFATDLLRAGTLNHGLARRESLLVVTDSLFAAATAFSGDSASWSRFGRLFATAEGVTQLYPSDPQAWYKLGEVRLHFGPYAGIPVERARDALERAVALDSAFAPAYLHLFALSLLREGPEAARHYVDRYLAQGVRGMHVTVARAIDALLDPARSRSPEIQTLLDSIPPAGFANVLAPFALWPDTAETAVRVARMWAESSDSVQGRAFLAVALSHRGHVRAALTAAGTRVWPVLFELALLGLVPPETQDSAAAASLEGENGWPVYGALRWWAARGDTAMLDRAAAWLDTARLPYARRATDAYQALARGDSATALQRFAALRTWPCGYCYHERFVQAQLLVSAGDYEEALALLDEWRWPLDVMPRAEMVLWALERARLNDALRNRDAAFADFSYVRDAWRYADPELQPYVDEARAAVVRLAGEPYAASDSGARP